MRIVLVVFVLGCLFPGLSKAGQQPCGNGFACPVAGGQYRIELPKGKPVGVYIFFHGYKASSAAQMKNRALVETVLAHHLAFAALEGVDGSWSIPNGPEKARDDQAYVDAVLDDLHARHGFSDKDRLLGGFSLGASMAWYTACAKGDRFAAMLTFSGVFWDPLPSPESCVTRMPPMIHVHGRADETFPLHGRAIGARYHQGDTFRSISIYRSRASCRIGETVSRVIGRMACDVALDCQRGQSLLCLHTGGHQVKPADLDQALTALGYSR